MDKRIQLTFAAGPFGDASSRYNVTFPRGITVEKFMKIILEENPQEWGYFSIHWIDNIIASYGNGEVTLSKNFDAYKKMPVLDAQAHGGWGRMDYYLEISAFSTKIYPTVNIFDELTDFPF